MRRGYDQDILEPGQHEHRQGVVDHGFVIDGEELLTHYPGDRMEARARSAGEDDSFHDLDSPKVYIKSTSNYKSFVQGCSTVRCCIISIVRTGRTCK